jgi:hypothetical protein
MRRKVRNNKKNKKGKQKNEGTKHHSPANESIIIDWQESGGDGVA